MTRQEQLVFCRKCLNRKMDLRQGLICALTGEKANFEKECPAFQRDESVKDKVLDDQEILEKEEIKTKLPPEIFEKIKMEQNLMGGIIGGILAGLLGAIIWGVLTVTLHFQLAYIAIAIGTGIGFTVRKFGKGINDIFGFVGATISLLSIILGNIFSIIGFIAEATHLDAIEVLVRFDYSLLGEAMKVTVHPIDSVFYLVAIFAGYKFSFRRITEKTILELKSMHK